MFEAIKTFRKRLADGLISIGPGIYLADPRVTDALADSVDFFWIELEHNALSHDSLCGHLMAARGKGKPGLVRLPDGSASFIKPMLDSGADGIIVPQVRSADEVRHIVADCRYPPVGKRGFGPLVPTNYGRANQAEYLEQANSSVFVSVMIETVEAVQAIDRIVAIPGLDSVILGPWDLSGSLGLLGNVEHPKVVAAMEKVIDKARAAGLGVGSGMGLDVDFAAAQVKRGVQWLQMGCDISYMVLCMDQITSSVRNRLNP